MQRPLFSVIAFFGVVFQQAFGDTLYYDTNGSTGGTSTTSTQNLTDSVWTINPLGLTSTTGYTAGSDIVFSANDGIDAGTGSQSVTVTDTESANSFTFNNGTVTLYGAGSPNLGIGAGGITVGSTINGATTLDSSLGTLTVGADQSWNNNSGQALNVNSNVTAAGNTLTFAGTGSGAINLNGQISGNLNLTDNSATSTVNVENGSNSFSGPVMISGGVVNFAHSGSLAGNSVNLSNGGTVSFDDTQGFGGWNNTINLGTGGGKISAGVVGGSGIDLVYNGMITGGTGLTLVNGDLLLGAAGGSNIGTLNVSAGRLLAVSSGDFDNGTVVNVVSNLDFGVGGPFNNTINLADGSALENRSGGVTLSNVVMPTAGTVTLGSDDVGGGSITINSAIDLTGALTLDIISAPSYNATTVNLGGVVSGSGPLTVNGAGTGVSPLFLSGNNTYSGPTTLNNVTVFPEGSGFGTSTVTLNNAMVDLTGGTLANDFLANSGGFDLVAGAGAQALAGTIHVTGSQSYANVFNHSSSNLSIGDVTFDTIQNADRTVNVDAFGTGSVSLDGTYISPSLSTGQSTTNGGYGASTFFVGYFSRNSAANYYVDPSADFSQMEPFDVDGKAAIWMFSGNLYLDNSTFVQGQFIAVDGGGNESVNIVGAQTINAGIYIAYLNQLTIAQTTADESTFLGTIDENSTTLVLSAVAGGRLEVTNLNGGTDSTLVKTGGGTVDFNNPNGNQNLYDNSTGAAVAVDIQQGTLVVSSTSGAGYGFGRLTGSVNIEKGATLAGNFSLNASQTVIAEDKTSVLAPGTPGDAKYGISPTIGTMTIIGNLTTASNADPDQDGITMDFKLNGEGTAPGVNSDYLIVGGGITLNGAVTINLIALDPLVTGSDYLLIQDNGTWDGTITSLTINVPVGYALDPSFGTDDGLGDGKDLGYIFANVDGGGMEIQLIAVPEPSSYGLLGLGLLGLVGIGRLRRLGETGLVACQSR